MSGGRLCAMFARSCVVPVAIASAMMGARTADQSPVTVLQARALVDVQRGVLIDNGLVVVTGDRITAAGPSSQITVPEGARRVVLAGATLLPGLVDLHVHLTLAGNPEANARATLQAGFTTVQDLGAITYASLDLRDAIAAGKAVGPRVVASGPWIGLSGGICDFRGIGVRGADAFRRRVQEDVARGADLIKVCVSGWLQDAVDNPDAYEIGDAELVAAIEEAHRHKRKVAVHALSRGGIRAAIANGADLVVHAGFADQATIQMMRTRGVRQLPTLHSLTQGGGTPAEALVAHMKAAVGMGLPVAFGTDAGVIPHGKNAEEFDQLPRIGLTPAAAIRAATIDAAQVLGWDDRIGTITAGKLADIIAVDGNPLEEPAALKRVVFVMRGGQVYRDVKSTGR